jgi:NAD(P)H-hydrate epimerase
MRLIRANEQQMIDQAWQSRTGLPLLLLMEHAALAVVRHCHTIARACDRQSLPVLVLAGRGQNGGDALACARILLAAGWPVICRELFPEAALPAEAAANRLAWLAQSELGLPTATDFAALRDGLVIDGIFGSGFDDNRPVPDIFRDVSQRVRAARLAGNRVLAIDVPSGVAGDSGRAVAEAIRADWTVTFVRPKVGLLIEPGRSLAGTLIVDPITLDDSMTDQILEQSPDSPVFALDGTTVAPWCPRRPPDSHKGLFGRALLIGGAPGMPGAVLLAAEAIARSGVGLLSLAVPEAIAATVLAARPEALLGTFATAVRPTELVDPDPIPTLLAEASRCQAIAVGPGLGRPVWLPDLLEGLLSQSDHLVIDADALNELARQPDHAAMLLARRSANLQPPILTPHPGEFRRLAPDLDPGDRLQAARILAGRTGCVVVLKGAATIVAEPNGRCWINTTGQDGLARGGSGDVLCGLIAGLLAQGLPAYQAAAAGVYLHGLAADQAARRLGRRAMLPRDVIVAFGGAFAATGWEIEDIQEGAH